MKEEKVLCPNGCGRETTIGKSGKPLLCSQCKGEVVRKGLRSIGSQLKPSEVIDQEINTIGPPIESVNFKTVEVLFSVQEDILKKLKSAALHDVRTPEEQVVWYVARGLRADAVKLEAAGK